MPDKIQASRPDFLHLQVLSAKFQTLPLPTTHLPFPAQIHKRLVIFYIVILSFLSMQIQARKYFCKIKGIEKACPMELR
jgi:hypothetical protein